MWVNAQMNCHTEVLVNPADSQSVITDGIHAGRWVLVCRHVVCRRIAVCAFFHSGLCVVSNPPHDTSVNTSLTHTPPVACMSACACVLSNQTGLVAFRWGPGCFHATCVSNGTLAYVCDRGLLCVQNATLSQVTERAFSSRPTALIHCVRVIYLILQRGFLCESNAENPDE